MAMRAMAFTTLAALTAFSTGCSGSDEGEPGGTTSEAVCNPDGEIPCYVGKTEPCSNFDTGWRGDELCVRPPDPSVGFQLHVGPENYDDPIEVAKWVLPPGGYGDADPQAAVLGTGPDVNWCYFMKTPNTETVFTSEYYSRMRPGSHHYIQFSAAGDIPDSDGPGSCAGRDGAIASGGSTFLSGATRAVQNAAMYGDAPEDEGLGAEVPPRRQVTMNLHFVNVTEEPILQEIWVNTILKPESEVTDRVFAMEWIGGLGMDVPVGSHQLVTNGETSPPLENTRILGVTAHAHASTVRVSMYKVNTDGSKDLVFSDYDWEEPTVWLFNSKYRNETPDEIVKRSGSPMNGVFQVNPADKFTWECEVVNRRQVNLTFSDRAYDGEMCNVFGMYSHPNAQRPWTSFSLTGGRDM